MNKFTPGPWKAEVDYQGCPYVSAKNKDMVADIQLAKTNNGFVSAKEAIANAHLIAAAPEMLESLKWARDIFENQYDLPIDNEPYIAFQKGFNQLKNAINKAKI